MWSEAKAFSGNKHYLIKKQLLYTIFYNKAARTLHDTQMRISHMQSVDQNIQLVRKMEKAREETSSPFSLL